MARSVAESIAEPLSSGISVGEAPRPLYARWRAVTFAVLVASLSPLQAAEPMTLGAALQAAQQYDASYAAANADAGANALQSIQLSAALRPTLAASAGGDLAYTDVDGISGSGDDRYSSWNAALQLSQPLYRFDWAAIRDKAELRRLRAAIGLQQAEQDLQLRVAQRYFGVLTAEQGLLAARARLDSAQQALADSRQRYAVELIPGTDLREAEAREDLSRAQLIAAERDLRTAVDELSNLVGPLHADLAALAADAALGGLSLQAPLQNWLDAARESNLVLLDARAAQAEAEAELRSAKARSAPSVDLVGSVQHSDTSDYVFGQRADDARIGVSVALPLYAGGALRAARSEAALRVDAATQRLLQAERDAERTTRIAYRDFESGLVEVEAYAKTLGSARIAAEAVSHGYDAGTRTIADVLNARSAVVDAQLNLEQARYQSLLNLLTLKQAAGRLSADDLALLDGWLTASVSLR